MTNNSRTSDEIEREIANERAQMSGSINDLQKKFSVDAIISELGNIFRGQGGEFGRSISNTVARNPTAVVMAGVGLAWLLLGRDQKMAGNTSTSHAENTGHKGQSIFGNDFNHHWYNNDVSGDAPNRGNADKGNGAAHASNGIVGSIQNAASTVVDAASDAASNIGSVAKSLSERLSHGLEDLSEEAKSRVLAARHAAHEARLSATAAIGTGSRAASNFFVDQPLVAGALAVALGAALGGVLPRSKIEDETLGASSDRLYAEAQAIFKEERDNAKAATKTMMSNAEGELRKAGADIAAQMPDGKAIGETITDRASDLATRIADRTVGKTGNKRPNAYEG